MSTSATPALKIGATALGYFGLVASWRRPTAEAGPRYESWRQVIISSAASTDEGVHEPAQSVTINSREGLLALRDAIDEALKEAL